MTEEIVRENDLNLPMDMEDLDIALIEGHPWAQKLLQNIQKCIQKGFLNWCKIVLNLGVPDDALDKWSQTYFEQVERTCLDLMSDVVDLQTRTINKIKNLLCQLDKLCGELHQKLPPKIGADRLSLFEEHNQLSKKVQEYQTIIDARKNELDSLRNKQLQLCKSLGKEPKVILEYPPLPAPTEIEELKRNIEQLESEKFDRDEKYFTLKEEIANYVAKLNYKPRSDFETYVLSSDNFLVTTDNMEKLDIFHKYLKELLKSTEEEISHLRGRIEELWRMLEIDIRDQDEFRTHYTGISLDTLKALRVEIKRCEEIRRANMKIFIDKLRQELEEIWIKCHCTPKVKTEFRYFNSDCFTEDLLELHELELSKWKNYYEENKKLLNLIEKHKELWERVIELEDNATGPNRYKNRGGKLLQEEKERNRLSKMIPKIEEEILEQAKEYKVRNHGSVFLTYGLNVEEYIASVHGERENIKKLKLSARKTNRENTLAGSTPGKSAINLFPSTSTAVTPTALSSTKRKMLATPSTGTKKHKALTTPSSSTKQNIPNIKITHATMSNRQKRFSSERKKRIENLRRRSRNNLKHAFDKTHTADTTANTTYSDFQNELSSRDEKRSTILPQETLMTLASSKLNTPHRTPLGTPSNKNLGQKSPQHNVKLSACKSNLKLLF